MTPWCRLFGDNWHARTEKSKFEIKLKIFFAYYLLMNEHKLLCKFCVLLLHFSKPFKTFEV